MRDTAKYLLVVATATALAGAGTLIADASWSIPGTARVKIPAAAMPRGATPSAAVQGRTAVVSWSAQEIAPGVKIDHYVVTAHNVNDLPDVSHTVEASGSAVESLVFTANEVGDGKWYWTIVPKFHLWTGGESGKSQRLALPASRVTTPTGNSSPLVPVAPTASPVPAGPPASPIGTPATETTPPTAAPPTVESAPASTSLPPPPTGIAQSTPVEQ
jgi:hypothetical protein